MNKLIRNILALVGLSMFSCQLSWAALTKDGEGYYLIKSAANLAEYRDSVNQGIVMDGRLTADIDLKSVCGVLNGKKVSWVPINTKKASIKFDGANHTISNLYIDTESDNQGLFYCVDEVKDLIVKDAVVKGGSNVGGILADGCGTSQKCLVANCHFKGAVLGKENVGGLVGYVKKAVSFIVNCSNSGTVVGGSNVGGLCGYCYGSRFYNCYNLGHVKAVSYISSDLMLVFNGIAGGIVGSIDGYGCYNCFNYNKISGLVSGSIVGQIRTENNVTLNNCYSLEGMALDNGCESAVRILPLASFKNGTLLRQLTLFLTNRPTCELPSSSDVSYNWSMGIVEFTPWYQIEDIDDYPRFEKVVLRPSKDYVVTYRGDYFGVDFFSESMTLPVCEEAPFYFSFENSFDGKKVVGDTVVIVTKTLKEDFLERDKDGFYLIHNGKDLSLFRDAVNGGANTINGRLTANIDMQSECKSGWTPIGYDGKSDDKAFSGVFDGNKFAIINLNVGDDLDFAGLFAYAKNATIENVILMDSEITGNYAGAICAYAESSTIVNCGNEASVKSVYPDGAAGFCAVVDKCFVANCYNVGTVASEGKAGGLFGVEYGESMVCNCYTSCEVICTEHGIRSPFFFEDLDPNVVNCYYDSVMFNASSDEALLVNDLVKVTTTSYIKSHSFVYDLNMVVDSLNSIQDTIVYYEWVRGASSNYPRFSNDENPVAEDDNESENVTDVDPIVLYSVNGTLYIESNKEGVAAIFNMKGQVVRIVSYRIGITEVYGLPNGVYAVGGKKVLLR